MSAYLPVSGFLSGEKAAHRAPVITSQKLQNLKTVIAGTTATVESDYAVGATTRMRTPELRSRRRWELDRLKMKQVDRLDRRPARAP